MTIFHKTICASLVAAIAASGAPARANDGEREIAQQINQANSLLRSGDTDKAIGAYQQAQTLEPQRADLSYNMAIAQYRKGDMAAAEHLFQTASADENDALAAKARYNLGNCNYASALQLAKTDRPAAIKGLESAIANYRSALDIDVADSDARANIELAANLIDKLKEEEKKSQQQKDQQKDQQKSDGKDENKDKQPSEENNQQQNDKQQSKGEESPKDDSKPQPQDRKDDDKKDQQQKPDKKSPAPKDQPKDESGGENKKEESKPDHPQPQQKQQPQTGSNKPEQSPAPAAGEPSDKQGKEPPKGELTAAEKPGEKPNDQQNKLQAAEFDPAKDGEMTKQEAQKMLQAIRDREMIRRMHLQAAERNQHQPVDRDW